MQKINLKEKLAQFQDHWHPRIVGELNGQHVKVAKIQGEFDWHHHETEDEMFLVLDGNMKIELRDRTLELSEGEAAVIPAGVEHRPSAERECAILLFEPASTLNTGTVRTDRTHDELERL